MTKFVRPFNIGDQVEVIKSDSWFCRVGATGYITGVEFQRWKGEFEYFMDGSGWYRHNCFKLVKKATRASIKKAFKIEGDI